MSSNFEMTPQELYVDWPEQPWPRLSGQLDRKQTPPRYIWGT